MIRSRTCACSMVLWLVVPPAPAGPGGVGRPSAASSGGSRRVSLLFPPRERRMGDTNAGGADGTAPSKVRAWLDIVSIAVGFTCGAQRRRDINNRSGGHDLCPPSSAVPVGWICATKGRTALLGLWPPQPSGPRRPGGKSIIWRDNEIHSCNEISSSRCVCYMNVFNIVVKGAFLYAFVFSCRRPRVVYRTMDPVAGLTKDHPLRSSRRARP
jgi:hypothetical protein